MNDLSYRTTITYQNLQKTREHLKRAYEVITDIVTKIVEIFLCKYSAKCLLRKSFHLVDTPVAWVKGIPTYSTKVVRGIPFSFW